MKRLLVLSGVLFAALSIAGCQGSSKTSIAICNDTSNAIRALELLNAKGYIKSLPVNSDHTELTFSGTSWTDEETKTSVSLVAEELLVQSMPDYTYVCLPCNTAMTGHVKDAAIAKEDDAQVVANKSNGIVCRKSDYETNLDYRGKIDVLTDLLLSETVSTYVTNTWHGQITCNKTSQIDLREAHTTVEGKDKTINVCASDIPHADILNSDGVKNELNKKGYTLNVTILNWSIQNDAVAKGDYDCNYFQHLPYLNTQNGQGKLFMTAKVHYEPLGIYKGGK